MSDPRSDDDVVLLIHRIIARVLINLGMSLVGVAALSVPVMLVAALIFAPHEIGQFLVLPLLPGGLGIGLAAVGRVYHSLTWNRP